MRIAPVRPNHQAADVKNARKILKQEIDHPARSVMIIRGDNDDVASFADRVATRSDAFPWREAVWLKVTDSKLSEILNNTQLKWFDGHGQACAVLLDFQDRTCAWLSTDATLYDIDMAYWDAKG